jgi:hypothetical protein
MPELITASRLRGLTEEACAAATTDEELATGWITWFENSAKRILKTTAMLGYTNVTLDLPRQLSAITEPNIPQLRRIYRAVRRMVPGVTVTFIEEEYNDITLMKIDLSWALEDTN